MKKLYNEHFKRDVVKLFFVFTAVLATISIFFINPTLSTPTLLALVIAIIATPWVAFFERRGLPRIASISIIFILIGGLIAMGGVILTQHLVSEWDSFREKVPKYFVQTLVQLGSFEDQAKSKYEFLSEINFTEEIKIKTEATGQWFIANSPEIIGQFFTWLFIVPFIAFVMLNDGRTIKKKFYQLVPNRFFESTFLVINQISSSMSDYVRAKLVEAFLVGLMVTAGLAIIQAPYALVLGIIAGVTNILPYVGPIIGAVPGILIAVFDPQSANLLLPIVLIYTIANGIDMVFIFPLLVAKLVNLHPLILIVVVILGQQYYGLVGMLVSIPVATALKVILQEIYIVVYQHYKKDHLAG